MGRKASMALSISELNPLASREEHSRRALGGTLGGIAAALVALEVLFRVLPVSTSTAAGYYFDPVILTYPAHQRFVISTGWALRRPERQLANNFGFLADHDFRW